MPKKANPESQAEQSERFKKDAQKLIDDGSLSLTEADAALDSLVRNARTSAANSTSHQGS